MLKHIYDKILPELKTLQNGVDMETASKLICEKIFGEKLKPTAKSTNDDDEVRRLLEVRTNQSTEIPISNDDVWIFGYGSLVWKADFPFIDRRCGFIRGYQRLFYQNSIDHRGIPTKPGRVVTLMPTRKQEDCVYGMAYRIAASQKAEVLQHLDYREKNGYERCVLKFYEFPESTGVSFDVIMYIATAENESYAGSICELPAIADQIFTSAGPSGANREYLFHLAIAMRTLFPGVKDRHLFDLEQEVLKRIKDIEPIILEKVLTEEIKSILNDKHDIEDGEARIERAVIAFEDLRKRSEQVGWKERILTREYLKVNHS